MKRVPKFVIYFLIVMALIFTLKGIEQLFYITSKITCGHFYDEGCVKEECYFYYHVVINGEESSGSISIRDCKIQSLVELKKLKCIQIEYSESNAYFHRVVDDRVLK